MEILMGGIILTLIVSSYFQANKNNKLRREISAQKVFDLTTPFIFTKLQERYPEATLTQTIETGATNPSVNLEVLLPVKDKEFKKFYAGTILSAEEEVLEYTNFRASLIQKALDWNGVSI